MQPAIDVICVTVTEGVSELSSEYERHRIRTTRYEPDWTSDGQGDSDGDTEVEKRTLKACKYFYRQVPRPVSPVQVPKRESISFSSLGDESKVLVASEREQQHTVVMLSTSAATQIEEQALQTLTTPTPSTQTSPELNR